MHPDVKQQKMSYVSSHFRLGGCDSLLDIAHGTPISITLVTPARHLLFTPNMGLQPEARPPLISPPPDSWHLLWDCYWVNDELRMHASFSCSFLRSIIRDYSRSSAAAPRRIKVCVSEIYWPNNNLCSRPTGPSSSINLNLHRNTIRAHIYLWQHSLHYSSLCGGNLIRSSSWN